MAERFRSALTEANLISAATVAVVAGQTTKLGERKIEAGELLTIGYGEQSGQQDAVGRLYVSLKDTNATPVQMHGTVRFTVYTPQNRVHTVLCEFRTETLLYGGANDRALNVPLPENFNWISEDKKLVLEFTPDQSGTLSKVNSDLLMDVTIEAI
jgi:hypothetical protein